jgi:3-oxoacyl-[acyl-carrier protein] reductase
MELGLQGKVAIVTGSSEGIGYAVALELAREGAKVVICGRRDALLEEARQTLAEQTGAEVLAVRADVQQLSNVRQLVQATVERFGAVHILVNNAGSVPRIQFTDVEDADWPQLLEGKLINYIRVAREVVPEMQKLGWGRIVNIAGGAGRQPTPSAMAVGLNNAAVLNWTKSMSLQYAADGILVNAVAPGQVATPRQVRGLHREAEIRNLSVAALEAERTRDLPLKRSGKPEEIAGAVAFLASERSSYMTGSLVTVDGGVTRVI